jgi:hypothetical protein
MRQLHRLVLIPGRVCFDCLGMLKRFIGTMPHVDYLRNVVVEVRIITLTIRSDNFRTAVPSSQAFILYLLYRNEIHHPPMRSIPSCIGSNSTETKPEPDFQQRTFERGFVPFCCDLRQLLSRTTRFSTRLKHYSAVVVQRSDRRIIKCL